MSQHFALCRSVGSGIPFVLGDGADAVTVLLQPLRLVDWGVLEQILLLEKKKAIVLSGLTESDLEDLKESIKVDRSIGVEELFQYACTTEGAVWRLWLSLRQEYSYWQCVGWIDTLTAQKRLSDYLVVAAQVDGIDLFASLDWPKLPFQDELALLRKATDQKDVDWRVYISAMAENYHVSPREFGELTYYQARLLLWDRDTLQGKVKVTPEEYRNIVQIRKGRRFFEERQAAQKNASSTSMGSSIDSPPLEP